MQELLQTARTLLAESGRYKTLSEKREPGSVFEILFAYFFEVEGLQLEYEIRVDSVSRKSSDFLFLTERRNAIRSELNSPELDDHIENAWEDVLDPKTGQWITRTVELSSRHPINHLRPEAQTIRLQEKILDKVIQLPPPLEQVLSVIVMNCQHFHFGNLDIEDVRMVMYGRTRNPAFQEWWNNRRLSGLCEENHPSSQAPAFRYKISAVLFIPDATVGFFDGAYIALNTTRLKAHQDLCKQELQSLKPLKNLVWME